MPHLPFGASAGARLSGRGIPGARAGDPGCVLLRQLSNAEQVGASAEPPRRVRKPDFSRKLNQPFDSPTMGE